MRVEVTHPETGEKCFIDIPSLRPSDLDQMTKEHEKDEQIKSRIEQLPLPKKRRAETRAILFKLAKFTIKAGNTLIKVGKRALEMAFMLADKYKHAAFGLILGALLTVLIGSIPLLGPPLAAFLGPLLMLFGLGKGLWEDLKNDSPKLAVSITEEGSVFQPLNPAAVS